MDIDVIYEIARWLRIPPSWLSWPELVTFVIIPFIMAGFGLSYMFGFIFVRVGILRKVPVLKWIFGFGLAFYALSLGSVLGLVGGAMIAFFGFYEWKWRVTVFILILILYLLILPYLMNMIASMI